MHLSTCCTPRPRVICGRGECAPHTVAACDWQSSWFPCWRYTALWISILLLPPSILNFVCMTFVSWRWPLDIWPAPMKTKTSRPKRPPLTEAPETQRCGRAHHSESPVWLAACPAITCLGQREQSRRQTPYPQESHVRREAAEHRRWEFAQESPLCRVTEAEMEQGENEREDAILLTHTCRNREGRLTS